MAHQLLHHFDIFVVGFEQRGVRVPEGMYRKRRLLSKLWQEQS